MPTDERTDEEILQESANAYMAQLREKILFGLSIYKYLNPSMLHVFLGTSTPSSLWKDQVLEQLLAEGAVVKTDIQLTSPSERSQSYTILHLPENKYSPPEVSTPVSDTEEAAVAA